MGRRKARGRKRATYKEVDYTDEDQQQLIQQTNAINDNTAAQMCAQELHPLPSSSRHSTRIKNTKVTEANMQSQNLGDQAEEVDSRLLAKDCELNREESLNLTNREASPNLSALVKKLNKNVSDAEEVDSVTHTCLVTVAGYKVKGEIAPLLREILNEHGDIASECILQTSQTRATLLESICMIYQELEPKMPNIVSLEVNSMQARIKDLETVRLRVEWLYKRLEEVSTVKGLLEKFGSLDDAKARCTESIEREERDLKSLEAKLSNLQQKISSKKTELLLLKSEAETITAALPEQSVVPVIRSTGGKKLSGPMPITKVLNRNDTQLHSQNSLQQNNYKFITDAYQQLCENDHPQPGNDSVSVAYLKAQSWNPRSHSQSNNHQCNFGRPHSPPQSFSQNPQHGSSRANLHAHSNRLSKPQHSQQFNPENEYEQNSDASSDGVNDMNICGGYYTPTNARGSNLSESSSRRVRGIRGITKPLRGWGSGQKMILQLNEHNQTIGKLASAFASQLGVLAKDGKKLPLIYTDWRTIPDIFKDRVWKEIKDNTNLQDICEKTILQRLSKLWRCWKGTVKAIYFTPYSNDNEKLAQHPPDDRIEKDQWPILVHFWKSKADLELRKEKKFEEVVNMRETGTVELVEMFSGMKQTPKLGRRGHMAFTVPSNRTQVPESSSMQPTIAYFEDHQGELPNHDYPSSEVEYSKRKKIY